MTDAPTTAAAPADAERSRRSAGFPSLSLPAAVQIIHDAGLHGVEYSLNAFAGYCGHRTPNSGPFRRKLASFKDWQLVSTNADRVLLTDVGKRFMSDPIFLTDTDALRSVFLSCEIMNGFYEDLPRNRAIKQEYLRRQATANAGVSAAGAGEFVTSLVESAMAAGLAKVDSDTRDGDVTFLTPAVQDAASSEDDGSVDAEADVVLLKRPQASHGGGDGIRNVGGLSGRGTPPVVLAQTWPTKDGDVVLTVRSRRALSAKEFELVAKAVGEVAALADFLGPEEPIQDATP